MDKLEISEPWRNWTRETNNNPQYERRLLEYERMLGFNRKELNGLAVLNLGAHKNLGFEQDLISDHIKTKIVSLSPDFAFEEGKPKISLPNVTLVSAIGEELPFSDESFDRVYDVGAMTLYSSDLLKIQKWLPEIARVLKKGGKGALFPVYEDEYPDYELFIDLLKRLKVSAGFEQTSFLGPTGKPAKRFVMDKSVTL